MIEPCTERDRWTGSCRRLLVFDPLKLPATDWLDPTDMESEAEEPDESPGIIGIGATSLDRCLDNAGTTLGVKPPSDEGDIGLGGVLRCDCDGMKARKTVTVDCGGIVVDRVDVPDVLEAEEVLE